MATKLTVKRLDLIKAIKEKAKANKKAYDEAVAAQGTPANDLVKAINAAMDAEFGKGASASKYTKNGSYSKANIVTYAGYIYAAFGIVMPQAVAEPKLFEKELAILEMATDETLAIDDSSDYFSFLKA